VGAAFGASFWITSYYGLIAALVAVVYLLYELVRVGGLAERLWTITLSCVALGVTMLMLAPGLFVYFRDRARVSHTISQANAETQRLGTEAASYALPSVHHPLFGDLVRRYEPARDFAENTLFFGYTTIILALIGIVLVVRRHPLTTTTAMRSRALVFAAILLPVAFWSSLRRVLHVAGVPIPTLSWFVTHITTYYRVYARFGVVVAIALVLLAAPALEHLVRRSRLGLVTAIAACFLVGFELLPGKVIAWQATDPPAYDVWLARQPEGIVVHYPLPTDKKAADRMSAREIYFQMFHGHPLFNVVGPGTKDTREDGIRVLSRYITDPSTPGILAAEGVKYILVHDRVYREQRETPPEVSGAFVPVREFPGVRVFELSPDVAPVDLDGLLESRAAEIAAVQGRKTPAVEYAGGFSGQVPGPDAGEWRRLEDEGRIVLVHDDPTLKRVLLYLRLVSEDVPRTVRLFDSRGALVGEAIVQPQATDVTFGPIAAHEGDTELVLTAEPGAAGDSGLLLAPVRVQPLADFSVSLRETPSS
jgi:hypothetical protein